MEIILIGTTVCSVIVAAAASAVAWRLWREEQRRSGARVAALASAVAEAERPDEAVMAPVRAQAARRSSSARPRADVGDLELRRDPLPIDTRRTSEDLFGSFEPATSTSRLAVVLAVGVFAVAIAIVLTIATGRREPAPSVAANRIEASSSGEAARAGSNNEPRTVSGESVRRDAPGSASAEPAPLELVALGHDRDNDRITIRGVVRNPQSGVEWGRLSAVVVLFNRDGEFLATERAPVEHPTLDPGSETRFVVTAPRGSDVARYRVSFRSDDRVVRHVDRRENAPLARLK
jgi:hypothetical protein